MKKDTPFPKKAAYFCLAAPFITAAVQSLTKPSVKSTPISDMIILILTLGMLISGIVFGIYSLFHIKKIKGILVPSSMGLILHGLIVYIGTIAFANYQNQYSYFQIHSLMKSDQFNYEQYILGRVHPKAPIEKYIESTANGIMRACPTCIILKKETYQSVPENLNGIFDNKKIKYTYVSIDTANNSIGDMRFVFPSIDPQPSCQDLTDFINQQKQKVKNNGQVSCMESVLNADL